MGKLEIKAESVWAASNHRVLPTAASLGWTHLAAAADPLRSTAEVNGKSLKLSARTGRSSLKRQRVIHIFWLRRTPPFFTA